MGTYSDLTLQMGGKRKSLMPPTERGVTPATSFGREGLMLERLRARKMQPQQSGELVFRGEEGIPLP